MFFFLIYSYERFVEFPEVWSSGGHVGGGCGVLKLNGILGYFFNKGATLGQRLRFW